MKLYKSHEDIERDLKRYKLERQIALEELKALKGDIKQDLQPLNWVQTGFKYAGKYGLMYIIKRILR